jgi:hypothetical protein
MKRRSLADERTRTALVPDQKAYVMESEEKGSDVNLASYLLFDGFRQDYEQAVIVSNDSDLAEPIRLVRNELNLKVFLLNPRKTVAFDLQGITDGNKRIRQWVLRDSQFPPTMSDASGTITKPSTW